MVVPFGFSIGDFINVANLFKNIGVALKDHGGAASDYQTTVKKLETIEAVLLSLKGFKSSGASLSQMNAIRTQASAFGKNVGQFLQNIKSYERQLGCGAPKGLRHGVYSKIKWAQYVSNEVIRLDESITFHLSILQTLLGMQTIDSLSAAILGQQDIKELITTEAASNTQTLTNINSQLRSNHHIQQDQLFVLRLIASQIQDFNERLSFQTRPTFTPTLLSPHAPAMSHAIPLRGANWPLADPNDKSVTADSNQSTAMALTSSHSLISHHGINDILNILSTEIETVSRFVIASVLIAIREFLIILPQVIIIAKIMRALPRAISLMRQDCIRFEDALGRIENLQYEHFRHWQIFEAMVQCNFEGVHGKYKVLRGQYTLTCPRLPGQRLIATSWRQHVFPGMTIVMAINVNAPDHYSTGCPKCMSSSTTSCSAASSRCHSCGLVFSRNVITDLIDQSDDDTTVYSTRGYPNGDVGNVSNVAGRRDLLTEWTAERPSFPDDDPPGSANASSDDETVDLKVFKRVNLLRKPIFLPSSKSTREESAMSDGEPDRPINAFPELSDNVSVMSSTICDDPFPDIPIFACLPKTPVVESLDAPDVKDFKGILDTGARICLLAEHVVADRFGLERIDRSRWVIANDLGDNGVRTMGEIKLYLLNGWRTKWLEVSFQVLPNSEVQYRYDALMSDKVIKRLQILVPSPAYQ